MDWDTLSGYGWCLGRRCNKGVLLYSMSVGFEGMELLTSRMVIRIGRMRAMAAHIVRVVTTGGRCSGGLSLLTHGLRKQHNIHAQ